ncbi:MAG: Hsp20 family protein [Myxococcota bacterium]
MEAKLSDGVLTVRVPKAPEAKPRAISVKAS